MIKSLILSLFCLLLISCDPVRNIRFINKTDSDIKVTILIDTKAQNYDSYILKDDSKDHSIVFNIKQKSAAGMHFGVGVWSDPEIDKFSNSVDNIEFDTKDIKTIYKTKESVKNLLKNNKHGFLHKNSVEINIE